MYKEMSVDWEKYRDIFPDRYLKPSVFDKVFNKLVQRGFAVLGRRLRILDIGGGLRGNSFHAVGDYYLLDTGVVSTEENTVQVSWDEVLGIDFDLIRIRGSIAYLSKEELERTSILAYSGAIVAFNTFKVIGAPIRVRGYTSKTGEGTEIIEANLKEGVIKHTLKPDDIEGGYVNHFYIRTVEEYIDLLDPSGKCSIIQGWRPPNSVWVTMGRGHSPVDFGI